MRTTYYVAASLDAFIADAGGGVDWLERVEDGDEDYGYATFIAGVDALVMGRNTWDFVDRAGTWPYGDLPTRVFTGAPIDAPHEGVRAVADTPAAVLDELAAQGASHVWLVGGGALATSFAEAGLLDELVLSMVPVVLGRGVPLFAPSDTMVDMEFLSARTFPSGLVQSHYRRRKRPA